MSQSRKSQEKTPIKIWHKENDIPNLDLIVIPGGFTFGDYLRCGALAARSPVISAIKNHISRGGAVLGVCNGFQILVELGALPGTDSGTTKIPNAVLHTNDSNRFEARHVNLKVNSSNKSFFLDKYETNQVLAIPNAHAEGKLILDKDKLTEIESNNQVAFRYCNSEGSLEAGYPWNPNGAPNDISRDYEL